MKITLVLFALLGLALAEWGIREFGSSCDEPITALYSGTNNCVLDYDDNSGVALYKSSYCNDTHLVYYTSVEPDCYSEDDIDFAVPLGCTTEDYQFYVTAYCSDDAPPVEDAVVMMAFENEDCTGPYEFVDVQEGMCLQSDNGSTYEKIVCNSGTAVRYVCSDTYCQHCKATNTFHPQTCTDGTFFLFCEN